VPKHYVMKAYKGRGCKTPLILDFDTSWPLFTRYLLNRRLPELGGDEKNSLPRFELRSSSHVHI